MPCDQPPGLVFHLSVVLGHTERLLQSGYLSPATQACLREIATAAHAAFEELERHQRACAKEPRLLA